MGYTLKNADEEALMRGDVMKYIPTHIKKVSLAAAAAGRRRTSPADS